MYKSVPSSDIELLGISSALSQPSPIHSLRTQHSGTEADYFQAADEIQLLGTYRARTRSNPFGTDVVTGDTSLPSDRRKGDHWFTKERLELLWRKLLSSGPAHSAQRLPDDDTSDQPDAGRKLAGWRKGTWVCCGGVVLCIITELVLLIWLTKTSIGAGILYEGSCDRVKNLSIWLLLPLNIAATVLIGTSNYVMQVMTAPSRSEIDQAHRNAQSVIIGGMTFLQNFGTSRDARARRIIWWTLVCSSLPIHLLLNSAIYSSVQAGNIGVLVVSPDFETDSSWTQCGGDFNESSPASSFACKLWQNYTAGQTKSTARQQCISQYANAFQANASSVIAVAATNAKSWYNPPQSQSVHVSSIYGLACQEDDLSVTYDVPYSERYFSFQYAETDGWANVTLPFDVYPGNISSNCSQLSSKASNASLESPFDGKRGVLYYAMNDTLSNITSILSVFGAIDYRYWSAAEVTGDYLIDTPTLSNDWDPSSWLCPADNLTQGCDATSLLAESDWTITPAAISVKECHVLPKQELCTLRFSWRILLITIFCDIVKVIAMIFALKFISKPLTTLGDVIESFLEDPDPCTQYWGVCEDKQVRKWTVLWEFKRNALAIYLRRIHLGFENQVLDVQRLWHRYGFPMEPSQEAIRYRQDAEHWLEERGPWWGSVAPASDPRSWTSHGKRWFVALPRNTRRAFAILYTALMILAVIYLGLGLKSLYDHRLSDVWTAGFSGPDPNALWQGGILSSASNITWAAVLVNSPQLFFSMLYFFFNMSFTLMHTAHEWGEFTKHRKALRVSSPRGNQRSTYWLQLPWTYSLPLTIASGTLHWLLGRSIYLIKVDVFGYFGEPQEDQDFFACGYSSVTTLALVVLLLCMGLVLTIVGFRKLRPGSPVVGFNSLAISAACHPDPSDKDIALQPLMWGVIRDENGVDSQHCSFSSREVSPLREGVVYQ